LGSWGNKYLSFGGRIVMVNAVLNAIPIFFLSYLKMPCNVWKEVVKIQRKFLWSGLSNRRKINWVKWEDVCKPKKEGGLGIRDLRLTVNHKPFSQMEVEAPSTGGRALEGYCCGKIWE
jgi:hypothetical protein